MRKGPKVKFDKDMEPNFDFHVDWAASTDTVMEAVHKELKRFGLEVLAHNSDGDYGAYTIRPIKVKK